MPEMNPIHEIRFEGGNHELDDRDVSGRDRRSRLRRHEGDPQALVDRAAQLEAARRAERRGLAWLIGAFVICPCHLPLTLGVSAALLGGTAIGALVITHSFLAGTLITLAWLAATWRGIHLIRSRSRSLRCRSYPIR
jgi:cytochrome c biogenesis protein CcdA